MSKEAMKLALEALEESKTTNDTMEFYDRKNKAITTLREALAEQPAQQPKTRPVESDYTSQVAYTRALEAYCDGLAEEPAQRTWTQEHWTEYEHSIVAGALFDFMGWLTSRKERIVLSSADNASPAVQAITEFAKMRGLSLDDSKVQDWQDLLRSNT